MTGTRRHRPLNLALSAALIAVTALAGCMFRDLRRNLQEQSRFSALRGTVSAAPGTLPADHAANIVVFAYAGDPPDVRIVDGFVLPRPGPYYLVVPVGTYRVAAFADYDGDRSLDDDEPVGVLRDGALTDAPPATPQRDLDVVLRGPQPGGLGFPAAVSSQAAPGVDEFPQPHVGELVDLDDRRFSEEAAQTGLWRPIDFLFEIGAGIYFLEPYDPKRIPVLFIHGALGSPSNWRYQVERLDRTRFQPWLVYYPTAVRLDITAAAIARWLQTLDVDYDFEPPVVVAHSMGGLVARALINQLHGNDDPEDVEPELFVTISTPWQGHAAAAAGVEHAPVVVPSWYDMAPGSPMLNELLREPLPHGVSQYLFFSYGGNSRLQKAANDGVVTLESQLDQRVQDQATRVIGFNADHRQVLTSPVVAKELGLALAAAAAD